MGWFFSQYIVKQPDIELSSLVKYLTQRDLDMEINVRPLFARALLSYVLFLPVYERGANV